MPFTRTPAPIKMDLTPAPIKIGLRVREIGAGGGAVEGNYNHIPYYII